MTDADGQDGGTGAAAAAGAPPLPLAGVRVVEIGQNLAGPYASAILASLGADVLKVERPEGGDDARGWGPPFWNGTATSFQAMNRDKRGITLDLKDPAAVAWLKEHLAQADVLVQNLRPGVMEDLGLDADTLLAVNPRLVYCSLWAFGHTGPMKTHPGYEPMIQAFAGMFSLNGTEDGPPARVGLQVLDLGTGVWAALGCIAALFRRQATGLGGVVDTSLFETAFGWMTVVFAGFNATKKQPPRDRSGNPRVVVFQAFETADGEIVIAAANDRLFAKLVRELGHPEWAQDPRYASNALRVEHKATIVPRIAEVLRTRGSDEWLQRLEAIGVPCAPIHDLAQVRAQPQTDAIGILQDLPGEHLQLVGVPVSFDRARPPLRHAAPKLGEHNAQFGIDGAGKPSKERT